MSVLVAGSFMMDCVTRTKHAPKAGETIVGINYNTYPGGKGANQAIAAKRLGAEVTMIGKVGHDAFGDDFVDVFKQEGLKTNTIMRSDVSTGIGSITLDEKGENRIVIIPGANMQFTAKEVYAHEEYFETANVIVSQLEVPEETVDAIADLADKYDKTFILNPAPMRKISDKVLRCVDILTPNETELAQMLGLETFDDVDAITKAAREVIDKGVGCIIVTLGGNGALYVDENESTQIPGHKVEVTDTVAAGDSFNGALAYMLDQGKDIKEAIQYANAVGALAVQKSGAIPSLPTYKQVQRFLKKTQK